MCARPSSAQHGGVSGDIEMLGRLLSYACLIGATIEYCEILARRAAERRARAEFDVIQAAGRRGLRRNFTAEGG